MSRNPDKKETLVPETNLYRKDRPSRWTVRRDQWFKNSMVGNPLVYTDSWRVTHEEKIRFFDTHARALAYADQQARTREYVLPRQPLPLSLPGIADDDALIYVTNGENGCVYLKDEDHSETLTLYAHELRPLALALLAHAERIEK